MECHILHILPQKMAHHTMKKAFYLIRADNLFGVSQNGPFSLPFFRRNFFYLSDKPALLFPSTETPVSQNLQDQISIISENTITLVIRVWLYRRVHNSTTTFRSYVKIPCNRVRAFWHQSGTNPISVAATVKFLSVKLKCTIAPPGHRTQDLLLVMSKRSAKQLETYGIRFINKKYF